MERIELGGGRYMIKRTPEEIQQLNRLTEITICLGLISQDVCRRTESKDPHEIQELTTKIDKNIKNYHPLIKSTKPTIIENVDEETVKPHLT